MQLQICLRKPIDFSQGLKVLVRGQKCQEHLLIQVGAHLGFPSLGFAHIFPLESHLTRCRTHQVQKDTKQGGLACAIVAHQTEALPLGNFQFGNIQHHGFFVLFFELRDLYHSSCLKEEDIS